MIKFLTIVIAIALAVPIFLSGPVKAGDEGMPNMPRIAPKKTYVIPSQDAGEELQDQRGYGDQESAVRMMNLMMVGGSGYEGMPMESMKTASAGGKNSVPQIASADKGDDMASMAGMEQSKSKTPTPAEGQTARDDIQTQITPTSPIVGSNLLEIIVQNKNTRKPVTGLKLKVQVFMTSMDMGTEEPRVKEVAPGKYQVKVAFAMKGPWAVKVFLPEGGEKILNYDVGASK